MTDAPRTSPEFDPSDEIGRHRPRHWFVRRLYTQNPFYLLSAGCMLHGAAVAFHGGTGRYEPWPLMALVCGYVLSMAGIGVAIVRWGSVWDDARSILLLIPLLLVELSLCFDDRLMTDPPTGTALLLTGLVFSMVVVEGVLWGSRIRLPISYRLPMHLWLVLLFAYPLWLVEPLQSDRVEVAGWRIFAFSPIVGMAFLTLLPAVRRGRDAVAANGTPWAWPWFPWPLFVMLAGGLLARTYALTLSFDPALSLPTAEAMQLPSAFGSYFLVPPLLAAGLLLLEIGLVERLPRVQALALAVPIGCAALSVPAAIRSAPYDEFLARLTGTVGGPMLWGVWLAVGFYAYAFVRRVRFADVAVFLALCAASTVGVESDSWATLTPPQPIVLAGAAAFIFGTGWHRRDSRRALAGLLAAVVVWRFGVAAGAGGPSPDVLTVQLSSGAVLLVAALFRDRFARRLRRVGSVLLLSNCGAALAFPDLVPQGWPKWSSTVYQSAVVGTSFAYAWGLWDRDFLQAAILGGGLTSLGAALQLAEHLERLGWQGVASIMAGLGLMVLAAGISAWKAGAGTWLERRLRPLRRR